jgi:8-oxo-dGTP pyrophosphatase MutT (NUDIX family)
MKRSMDDTPDGAKRPNPWKTLAQRTVYDNPWIRVEDHEVLNPAGRPGQYGKVCFKNRAVAVIALDDRDHVYLVGQYRYTLDAYCWELPMGGAPLSDDPLAAAQRELREETGLVAAAWRPLLTLHTSNSITDEVGFVYVAEALTQDIQEPEDTEDLEVLRVPFAEAVQAACDGRITDAMSVAALLALARQRAAGRSVSAKAASTGGATRAQQSREQPS